LIYSSDVSGAANVSPVAQSEGETNTTTDIFSGSGTTVSTPSSSTITWSSGTTASVPSLSPAAISYYKGLGVSVT
jgi:hypothetical protein